MTHNDPYDLHYTWRIPGKIERVFYYLSHVTTFPQWWSSVFLDSQSDAQDPFVGAKATVQARSILPYVLDWDLVMTRLEPPSLVEVGAHVILNRRFELTGSILYRLVEDGGVVTVTTDQEMRPTRPIPKLFRGLAGRMFRFNHAWAMARGEKGLRQIVAQTS